jgi:CDP-glucose 4,6-dehydratase
LPDCVRAFSNHQDLQLRNPSFRRPWQHVLEPLSGYLWLGAQLLGEQRDSLAEAWNFGPRPGQAITADEVVRTAIECWGGGSYVTGTTQTEEETKLLRLDWTKAANRLNWQPAYDVNEAIAVTMSWYRDYADQLADGAEPKMAATCLRQIEAYRERARSIDVRWARG